MDPYTELAAIALDTAELPSGRETVQAANRGAPSLSPAASDPLKARKIVDQIVSEMRSRGDDRWDHATRHERRDLLMHSFYSDGTRLGDLAEACGRYPRYVNYIADEIRAALNPTWRERWRRRELPERRIARVTDILKTRLKCDASDAAALKKALISDGRAMMETARELGAAVPFGFVLRGELEEIDTLSRRRLSVDPESWHADLQVERDALLCRRNRQAKFVKELEEGRIQTDEVLAEARRGLEDADKRICSIDKQITQANALRELWHSLLAIEDRVWALDCEEDQRRQVGRPWIGIESDLDLIESDLNRLEAGGLDADTAKKLANSICTRTGLAREQLEKETTKAAEVKLDTPATAGSPFDAALKRDLVGLACSGGGIRSATFNLGILQGMADLGLLRHVDYLSMVSGGGYIGSWLICWCGRLIGGIRAVQARLSPKRMPDPDTPAKRPIRFLREYSNYLTPETGFFSADTWTILAVWFRNTLLNQLVLITSLAAVLLVPRVVQSSIQTVWTYRSDGLWLFYAMILCLAVAVLSIGLNLRSFDPVLKKVYDQPRPPLNRFKRVRAWFFRRVTEQDAIQWLIVIPILLAAVLAPSLLDAWLRQAPRIEEAPVPRFLQWWAGKWIALAVPGREANWAAAGLVSGIFFCALTAISIVARLDRCFYAEVHARRQKPAIPQMLIAPARILMAWTPIVLANLASACIGGLLILPICLLLRSWRPESARWHELIFGAPLFVAVFGLTAIVETGLIGRYFPDERREWWSRVGSWLIIYGGAWTLLGTMTVYAPLGVAAAGQWVISGAATAWAAAIIGGILAGRNSNTVAGGLHARLGPREVVAAVAPWICIAGYLVAISFAIHLLFIRIWYLPVLPSGEVLTEYHWWLLVRPSSSSVPDWVVCAGMAALAWILAWRFDINEFSMHHFYKNRLVRCYLGASRGNRRRPNRFTGFDTKDDPKLATLSSLAPTNPSSIRRTIRPYVGPFPIINTTLNVVAGDDLAWQERKGESFVFTPLYSGFDYRPPSASACDGDLADAGYRPTRDYGYGNAGGIGLGTAVAISGAAANPNMGYHSSPVFSFLMTMFNMRLGWWLGNPRHKTKYIRSSPRIGLVYLFWELLGSTTNSGDYINLSDGGHFENLGIYELVRRRCRYIIACDGEQDTSLTFNGLANAVRKCRVDLGFNIDIDLEQIRKISETAFSTAHCVVGTIDYGYGEFGKLLYIKSSLSADEPCDVQEYSKREPSFPHETTADQCFDESQFESYRALGHHVAIATFERAALAPNRVRSKTEFFDYLTALWWPPSPNIKAHSVERADALAALFERARQLPALKSLDHLAFRRQPGNRDHYYYIRSLIQEMENTFTDLKLERDLGHPQNLPWMTRFQEWAADPTFQAVWNDSKHTYSERFRRFCEDEFGLPSGLSPSA